MKSLSNIETEKSRGGYRVGYGGGRVWHVSGRTGCWTARTQENTTYFPYMSLSGRTLEEVSDQLEKLTAEKMQRIRERMRGAQQ